MTIGKVWSHIAEAFVGSPEGRHCHWCKYIEHDEGCSYCGNPESPFHDGDRIRSWDGEGCAAKCKAFALDPWYEDDANVDKYFTPEAAASWKKEAQSAA